MNFYGLYTQLTEAKVEKIGNVKVWINPTASEIVSLFNNRHFLNSWDDSMTKAQARVMEDKEGFLYIWRSGDATHHHIGSSEGLDEYYGSFINVEWKDMRLNMEDDAWWKYPDDIHMSSYTAKSLALQTILKNRPLVQE